MTLASSYVQASRAKPIADPAAAKKGCTAGEATAAPSDSVRLVEPLGQVLDILRRPAGNLHAQLQAHLRQHFLDLVERLAPEVGRPQHLALGLLHEIADVDDVVVLQAVGRAHG